MNMLTEIILYNPLSKTVGTFMHGAGLVLGCSNFFPARHDLIDIIHSSLDDKQNIGKNPKGVPHFTPNRGGLDDALGKEFWCMGLGISTLAELAGVYFSIEKANQGDLLSATLYPTAKVITNGVAWIGKHYTQRKENGTLV